MNLFGSRVTRRRPERPALSFLVLACFLLIAFSPAESGIEPRSAPSPAYVVADSGPLIERVDAAVASMFGAFNRREMTVYLDGFAENPLILPDQAPLISGREAVAQAYRQIPDGLLYDGIEWVSRGFCVIGPWIIETGQADFRFRFNREDPVLNDPRQVLTVWEVPGVGAPRVKVVAWNRAAARLEVPTTAFSVAEDKERTFQREGDFSAVLEAEERFHVLIEAGQLDAASEYYAEGALLLPPGSPLRDGRSAIAAHMHDSARGYRLLSIEREAVHVEGDEEYVLVVNLFRWTFLPEGTGTPVSFSGKGVHIWERVTDGRWRILFDLSNPSQPTS